MVRTEAPPLFPLWQIDPDEYRAACAHLGVTPDVRIYERLSSHLARAAFRFPPPRGFAAFLARLRLTRFRIARLDVVTKLLLPGHPLRHALNGVIALHECGADGFHEMAAAPPLGWAAWPAMLGWSLAYAWRAAMSLPWLGWQLLAYAAGSPFRRAGELANERVLVTGVNRGLGFDLMLHCLEQGAPVVGTVRTAQALAEVKARVPAEAPVTLVIADLSQPGALVQALDAAGIRPESLRMAILNAGVKYAGESALSLARLRDTFQVNCLSAAEFAAWYCSRVRSSPGALVFVSSMGRWHGMLSVGGYNASKAALSVWAESLDMELRQSGRRDITVTVAEPGMFESGMTASSALGRLLFAPRRAVARRIVARGLAGAPVARPPGWFALLTWALCLGGRGLRYRVFARAKAKGDAR